ncbi:outer-membrane lipoprotein carrier protein [Kushneria pakistanensis]|uniref:Outer-membrane lipoprotein carrier protein n=1 Tax=Kushneria pakistanensis TaxID=1508770 RepID=A0ABQ3FN36_9GAMM|nr:outer membrane lipoprotein chaperone LolA [Kushneria pakistanensis]GHC30928.1 outer-membrane lipoprotein carrier protein [Kushneria pakistanensis]
MTLMTHGRKSLARTLGLTGAALMAACMTLPAQAASSDAERLTSLLQPLKTYSADFNQQVASGGGSLQDASGHMWLSRPGRFNWEVSDPYRQTVVSDGQKVYLYDPDLEQVSIRPLDQRVTHTPALLLSGQASELTENYNVSRRQQGTTEFFALSPRSNDILFESLELVFNNERLSGIDLTDGTGQRTEISFRNIEVNPDISASQFQFEIPEGADVMREGN